MTKRNDHTFAICAYKESPYLEECILSLKNQTVKSNIIMATSTPNEWIQGLAKKYEIPMDETTLLAEANKWELSHGGLSGRTAQQFINYLLGKE